MKQSLKNTNKIILSGFAGTGKSTVGEIIEKELGFKFISVGDYTRDYASKLGLSINEFQELCKKDPNQDQIIDQKFTDFCNSNSNLVIDYRLGFKFVENSFNVLLKVSDEEASKRIKGAKRVGEDIKPESIKSRNMEMKRRFIEKYAVDFTDECNYNLVIDTDLLSREDVAELIIKAYKGYENNR